MTSDRNIEEQFPSPPNMPPTGGTLGGAGFVLRKAMDLQVASVLMHLAPWLRGRSGQVLEIGCGAQPYRHLVPEGCAYRGLDWEHAERSFGYRAPDTTYYAGGEFPFPAGSFDAVFHTEVLEHVFDAPRFLGECRRVLKNGGSLFFSVPFQARFHYIPHDYWRFTPSALTRLLKEAGFTRVMIRPRGTDITVAAYKVVSVVYRLLQGSVGQKAAGILAAPLAMPLCLVIGHVSSRLGWGSPDDCLGYCVTAE